MVLVPVLLFGFFSGLKESVSEHVWGGNMTVEETLLLLSDSNANVKHFFFYTCYSKGKNDLTMTSNVS